MKSKPNNVIRIPCKLETFFRYWLAFLSPFHSLTQREIDIASAMLLKRYQLSKAISKPDILDMTVMGENIQREIREEFGITGPHYQQIKNKLKEKGFIVDKRINKRLIPNIKEENGVFQLLLVFEYNDDE